MEIDGWMARTHAPSRSHGGWWVAPNTPSERWILSGLSIEIMLYIYCIDSVSYGITMVDVVEAVGDGVS